MPLEQFGFIDSLNASNPVGATDKKQQGDDHIRGVKSTLLDSFPGIAGAMTLTHTQLNAAAIKSEENVFTAKQRISGAQPILELFETDGPADAKLYTLSSQAGGLLLQARTDLNVAGSTPLQLLRSGTDITAIQVTTTNVQLRAGTGLQLFNTTNTDSASFQHDGTNFNAVFVNTNIVQFVGAAAYTFDDDVRILGGELLRAYDTTNVKFFQAYHAASSVVFAASGSDIFDVQLDGATQGWSFTIGGASKVWVDKVNTRVDIRDGWPLRIRDASDNDFIDIYHNGTLAIFDFTGTSSVQFGNNSAPSGYFNFNNTGAEQRIVLQKNGEDKAWIRATATSVHLRSLIHGGTVNLTGEDATGNTRQLVVADPDGSVILNYNGTEAVKTQRSTGTGVTSGGQVKDHGDTYRDLGFNILPRFNENVSDTLEARHCGSYSRKSTDTARTLTLAISTDLDFPIDGVTTLINRGDNNNYSVVEGVGTTLFILDGNAAVDSEGTVNIGPGGVATLLRVTSTSYYIWGAGVSKG